MRITAVVSSFAVLAALSGCSNAGGSDTGGSEDALTVWTFKQSHVEALQEIGDAWGEQNDMTVEVSVYTPDDTYSTKIQSAAQSGTLPDILSVHSQGEDWEFAQAGIIDDLTEDFTDSWQEQFLPGVVSGTQLSEERIENSGDDPTTTLKDLTGGHFYSIPMLAGTPGVVFARKSMLENAGVDSSTPPATWQDWVSQMEKTLSEDPENGGLVTGLQVPETGYFWLYRPMAYAYLGADAFYGRQSESQDPSWTSAESVETLELYDQLTDLWAPGVLALGIDQADQAFASGDAAWDVGGTFTLASLSTFGLDAEEISVFPVPAAEGGELSNVTYQASPLIGGSITSTSTHKEEALSFLKYLTSVEGATMFAESALDLPATSIPQSDLNNPLLQQLVGLVSTSADAEETFNPNDFSADPAGTIASDTAVTLTKLPANAASVEEVAQTLSDQYSAAWDNLR